MGAGATWPSCRMLRGTAGAATRPRWPGAVAGLAQGALAAQQGRGWPGSVGGSWTGAEPAPLHVRSGAPLVAFILVRVISGSRESLPHGLVLVLPGGQGAAVMPLRLGQQRRSPPCRTRLRRAGTDPPPGRGVPDAAVLCPLSLRVLLCDLCKKRQASEVARHDLCPARGWAVSPQENVARHQGPCRAGGDSPSPTSTTVRGIHPHGWVLGPPCPTSPCCRFGAPTCSLSPWLGYVCAGSEERARAGWS